MLLDDTPGPVVRVNVVFTYDEYQDICRYIHRKLSGRFWWLALALIIFAIGGAVLQAVHQGTASSMHWAVCCGMGYLVVLGGAIVANGLLTPFFDQKRWRTVVEHQKPYLFVFSPSGVQITTGNSTSKTSWKRIVAAEKVGRLVFLIKRRGSCDVVPIDAFARPEDYRTFRQLVEALVPKCRW